MPTRIENKLTASEERPLIAPSILSADFCDLGAECEHVLRPVDQEGAGADLLHVDVMDGHFVPNLSLGPAIVSSLRKRLPEAFLDVHIMVTDPWQYAAAFAEAGADHLTFHAEPAMNKRAGTGMSPMSEGYDPIHLADRIRSLGMSAGLAINPPTNVRDVDKLLGGDGSGTGQWNAFDLINIMSVNPGYAGQAFIASSLNAARTVRFWLGAERRVQIDGGVAPDNAKRVRDAGVDVLVAASAIFGKPREERPEIVRTLRSGG